VPGRKTRKQKENIHRQFLYSWDQNTNRKPRVKRETEIEAKLDLAQSSAKKDILKSLILSSLVLSLEVVVYLTWSR
jgi:hypothetical protein